MPIRIPFPVSAAKLADLYAQMDKLGIRESDLDEDFIRGSGSGGQKRNKTSSAVKLVHRPSGIEIRCQRDRSQALNRFLARRELCDRLAAIAAGDDQQARAEVAKIRRQKARRARKTKVKLVDAKRRRGSVKRLRNSVKGESE